MRTAPSLLLLAAFAALPADARPQAWNDTSGPPGSLVWEATLPTLGSAVGNGLAELPDGAVAVAGYDVAPGQGTDAILAVVSATGDVRWTRRYGGGGDDFLWDVRPTADGGLVAVGFSGPEGGIDVWLVRTDSVGELVWERRYGGTGRDRAWSLADDGAGGWYVAAERTPEDGSRQDGWLLRVDPRGDTVWTRTLDGPEVDRLYSVTALPRGGAVVTGGTGSNDRRSGDNDVLVARFTDEGDLRWRRTFGGDEYDVGHGVLAAGDGVLVTGYGTPSANAPGDTDVALIRLDADGSVVWRRNHPGAGHERAMMSAPAHGGGWITIGFAVSAGEADVRLSGSSADGRESWRWTRAAPGTDRGVVIRPTRDGGYVLTGALGGFPGQPAPLRVQKLRLRAPG
jgi:hypothetical protein